MVARQQQRRPRIPIPPFTLEFAEWTDQRTNYLTIVTITISMDTSTHTMTFVTLVNALPSQQPRQQQQQQLAATAAAARGSISPVTGGCKVRTPPTSKRLRKHVVGPKAPRKSRVIYNFPRDTLAQYFHLSQREAAKQLGVAPITMKRNCKRQGITWPYRAKKIEAAHRARQEAEDAFSSAMSEEGDTDTDGDVNDGSKQEKIRVEPATDVSSNSNSSASEPMSEAALVFARLPFLCLSEEAPSE